MRAVLVPRRLYRVVFQVFKFGRWEKRVIDTYVRAEAEESLQTLRDLETATGVEPRLRVVRTTF